MLEQIEVAAKKVLEQNATPVKAVSVEPQGIVELDLHDLDMVGGGATGVWAF